MDSAPHVSRHGSGRTNATMSTVMLEHLSRYSTNDWLKKQRRRALHIPTNGKHQPLRGRSRTARRVWRSTRAMSRTSQCNVPPSLPHIQLWVSNHILNSRRSARRTNLKVINDHTNNWWRPIQWTTLMITSTNHPTWTVRNEHHQNPLKAHQRAPMLAISSTESNKSRPVHHKCRKWWVTTWHWN